MYIINHRIMKRIYFICEEFAKSMKLELVEKCVNGERATYLLQGKISLKE